MLVKSRRIASISVSYCGSNQVVVIIYKPHYIKCIISSCLCDWYQLSPKRQEDPKILHVVTNTIDVILNKTNIKHLFNSQAGCVIILH